MKIKKARELRVNSLAAKKSEKLTRLTLVIDIKYQLNGTPEEELIEVLHSLAHTAASQGLLNEGTTAVVKSWSTEVHCYSERKKKP